MSLVDGIVALNIGFKSFYFSVGIEVLNIYNFERLSCVNFDLLSIT